MKKIVLIVCLAAVICYMASTASAMKSDSFHLEPMVLSSVGGPSASTSFKATGTCGQPSPVGISTSTSYRMLSGYWYQLLKLISGGDVNGDGLIDLQDAVLALQILSNFSTPGIEKDADVDGDEAIGVPEAFYVLQKVGSIR